MRRNIIVPRIAGQGLVFDLPPPLFRNRHADRNLYFNTAGPGWGRKHLDAWHRNPAQDAFRLDPNPPPLIRFCE